MDDAPSTSLIKFSGGNAQLGQPHPFDVDSCVRVSIQRGVTAIAYPAALFECKVCIDSPAHMANLAGWCPPVDFYDSGSCVAGHPFKDRYKFRKSKVRDLPPPQVFHPIEIEVFDADDGVFSN